MKLLHANLHIICYYGKTFEKPIEPHIRSLKYEMKKFMVKSRQKI